jgi:hypothetical protein
VLTWPVGIVVAGFLGCTPWTTGLNASTVQCRVGVVLARVIYLIRRLIRANPQPKVRCGYNLIDARASRLLPANPPTWAERPLQQRQHLAAPPHGGVGPVLFCCAPWRGLWERCRV